MYSPSSPVLSSLDQKALEHLQHRQCLKFKYFTTFLISTVSLFLLSASLLTNKWIYSRPIRILRLGQPLATGLTTGNNGSASLDGGPAMQRWFSSLAAEDWVAETAASESELLAGPGQGNKYQGEVYFGLFRGLKVLNYGFGDRTSRVSVLQSLFSAKDSQQQQQLVDRKLWLATLASVTLAIVFALVSSIYAMINFVITPSGTLNGPIGLVIWNAIACFACLVAALTWLIEYFVKLKENVLTAEEVENGWTSDKRSQLGYSYYLVLLALILHLVNIFIISIVQFESWTSGRASGKRHVGSACEGVIMLY